MQLQWLTAKSVYISAVSQSVHFSSYIESWSHVDRMNFMAQKSFKINTHGFPRNLKDTFRFPSHIAFVLPDALDHASVCDGQKWLYFVN